MDTLKTLETCSNNDDKQDNNIDKIIDNLVDSVLDVSINEVNEIDKVNEVDAVNDDPLQNLNIELLEKNIFKLTRPITPWNDTTYVQNTLVSIRDKWYVSSIDVYFSHQQAELEELIANFLHYERDDTRHIDEPFLYNCRNDSICIMAPLCKNSRSAYKDVVINNGSTDIVKAVQLNRWTFNTTVLKLFRFINMCSSSGHRILIGIEPNSYMMGEFRTRYNAKFVRYHKCVITYEDKKPKYFISPEQYGGWSLMYIIPDKEDPIWRYYYDKKIVTYWGKNLSELELFEIRDRSNTIKPADANKYKWSYKPLKYVRQSVTKKYVRR